MLGLFSLLHATAGFLLCLLFDREDGDSMFLRNIGLSPTYVYMAVQPRRPYYLFIYLLIYGLFSDAISASYCIASNDVKIAA
jgi:hypothetical protein